MSEDSESKDWLVWFGLPFLLMGLFCIGIVLSDGARLFRSARWVEVPARIIEVSRRRGNNMDTFSVRYEYEYNGRSFVGTRYRFFDGGTRGEWAGRFQCLEALRESGATVPAWVDPKRPEQAVLVRDFDATGVLLPAVLGLVFTGVGGRVMVPPFREWRRRRRGEICEAKTMEQIER